MKLLTFALLIILPLLLITACKSRISSNQEMVDLLAKVNKTEYNIHNVYSAESRLAYYDSILQYPGDSMAAHDATYQKAKALLEMGKQKDAIEVFEGLLRRISATDLIRTDIMRNLAISYMRYGEVTNCVNNHGSESCIFPIQGNGIHKDKTGSSKAIEIFEEMLKRDPHDLESRWLLNIAYMTIGGYPDKVPSEWLIEEHDSAIGIKPFVDVAANVGLDIRNLSGGNIVDDFDNDGYPDIITSSLSLTEEMHYNHNNGDGTFADWSVSSGLSQFTGGLNMVQTDYNNDGWKDIFVLRGAWKANFGKEPNSLLRNNGDGTFTDVTKESGLLSFHPTQTATWNDFNNDGWLDLFIGNESPGKEVNPCEFYINNKNGTFTETALQSGIAVISFVKGVTSGDYDNDGLPDLYLSTMTNRKILFHNDGVRDGVIHFTDVTAKAGVGNVPTGTFPTWFWDYDNDGWLDILVCGYQTDNTLAFYAAANALHIGVNGNKQFLFHNNHNGTFEDVTDKVGLNKMAFAMGSNFGDINNDGYLDMYLGTGNPFYQSLVPNKMFVNNAGKQFFDVTSEARVGNLQKGHGVAFVDLDNDGDEDIYIEMGGALGGDAYQNSLYLNPGQSNNNWINLSLEGVRSNRAAIGAKIKLTFKENGITRSVYRIVNSGGSFGCNPLRQHIGIGSAAMIDNIEIYWPVTKEKQVFTNIKPGQNLKIKEGSNSFTTYSLKKLDFTKMAPGMMHHMNM